MRHESCVTSLSLIPSGAITGPARLPFDAGISDYDEMPSAELGGVVELRAADRFRFANVLRAWIDVHDPGRITSSGCSGGSLIGASTVGLSGPPCRVAAVDAGQFDRSALGELSEGHRREVLGRG
jgi:hypothetical protein